MDLHQFLRSRRSVRRFTSQPVPAEVLTRILETAMYAPSAHNRQPWRFAVLNSAETKALLADHLAAAFQRDLEADGLPAAEIDARLQRSKSRITAAPLVVVLCMDMSDMDVYSDPRGDRAAAERLMTVQSVAAAGLQLQLAACAEGLDSVWTCSPLFAPQTVQTALALPAVWEPQAMFFLGYAAAAPKEKTLKTLDQVTKYL